MDIVSQVKPKLVTSYSSFSKSRNLDKVVEMHKNMMVEPPTLDTVGISKVQT
jgi:hypothetical protein